MRQGGSCPLGSQSGEKKFSQNLSCYISLEKKFDADHFLRKDLGMKIYDFSENLLQSDLSMTLELNLMVYGACIEVSRNNKSGNVFQRKETAKIKTDVL